MKAIIMAAGYAVRLYPLTENQPKPLLPIAGRPIIEYIIGKLEAFSEIDKIYVVTNNKFYNHFIDWLDKFSYAKPIKIINDGTFSNQDRLGAIGDINFVIDGQKIDDDLIVVAGDNLFDFNLEDLKNFAMDKDIVTCAYDVSDIELAKHYGILSIDANNKVLSFVEKPSNPPSTLASLGIYYFNRNKVGLISTYILEGNNKDAPGFFLQWAYRKEDVYSYVFNGSWYDIGDLKSYHAADDFYKNHLKSEIKI